MLVKENREFPLVLIILSNLLVFFISSKHGVSINTYLEVMISQEQLKKLQEIFLEEYNLTVDGELLEQIAHLLLTLGRTLNDK